MTLHCLLQSLHCNIISINFNFILGSFCSTVTTYSHANNLKVDGAKLNYSLFCN